MTGRSRAREVALQLLFQRDHNPGVGRPGVETFVAERVREPALQVFCLALYDGVVTHIEDIDRRLTASADNWRLVRMATVDRNVLRLGAYELLFGQETPPAVAFDEAIELARRYGSAESGAFVNGVLDRLRREAATPAASGETAPGEATTPLANAGSAPPDANAPANDNGNSSHFDGVPAPATTDFPSPPS